MKRRLFLAAAVFLPVKLRPLAPVYTFQNVRVFYRGVELTPMKTVEYRTEPASFTPGQQTVEITCSNIVPKVKT